MIPEHSQCGIMSLARHSVPVAQPGPAYVEGGVGEAMRTQVAEGRAGAQREQEGLQEGSSWAR